MRRVFALIIAGAALALLPRPALAFGSCSDTAYVESFPGGYAGAECEEREAFSLAHGRGTSKVRVVSIVGAAHGDDAAWTERVERKLAAIGAELRSMGAVGTDDITILLIGDTAPEGEEGAASLISSRQARGGLECAVTIFKTPTGFEERHFDFLLAHELFHCAQYATFRVAVEDGQDWWTEGSAEHFVHMVVPDAGDFGRYAWFDYGSISQPLTAMSYDNVVFFHWLQMERWPDGLADFLSAMAAGNGSEAALRGQVDTAAWSAFTEALIEGRLRSPGGTAVPSSVHFTGDYIVDDTVDLPFDTTPFVATRYKVRFAKERHFRIELAGADGAAVRMQDDGALWSNLPLQVSTCPDEVTRLAYAVTADAATSGTINFIKEGMEGAGACCLEGEWTPTPETLAGLANFGNEIGGPAVAMQGGSLECTYTGGGAALSFRSDGTGALGFDGHTTTCIAQMQGQSMVMTATRAGSFDFDWAAGDTGAGMANYTDNSVGWTITLQIGPIEQVMSEADAGPSTQSNGFAFTCTETTLDILGVYGLSHKENRFTRPPRAPEP